MTVNFIMFMSDKQTVLFTKNLNYKFLYRLHTCGDIVLSALTRNYINTGTCCIDISLVK